MIGVNFDGVHSDTLGLSWLGVFVLSSPVTVTKYVEIPGRNGSLDYSQAVTGYVTYKDRDVKLKFELETESEEEYIEKISGIENLLHGKRKTVILDTDPNYQWDCRLKVDNERKNRRYSVVTITGTAYPYKRKLVDTIVQKDFCGKNLWDMDQIAEWLHEQNAYWVITEQEDGSYSWKASSQQEIIPFPGKPNTAYTLSLDMMLTWDREWTSARGLQFDFYYSDGTSTLNAASYNQKDTWVEKTFTTNAQKTLIGIGVQCINPGTVTTFTKNLQIEEGEATPYEAYTPETEAETMTINNLSEPVVPEVICSHPANIVCGGKSYSLPVGTSLIDMVLAAGETQVTVTTAGPVAFKFREGSL